MKKNPKLLLNKAFFGKNTCFKLLLNSDKEVYFHMGINQNNKGWNWKRCKMSDVELGEIIWTINQEQSNCSFFHSFGDDKTQIWCRKDKKSFSIKIDNVSKSFQIGETQVLKLLLETCIKKQNA